MNTYNCNKHYFPYDPIQVLTLNPVSGCRAYIEEIVAMAVFSQVVDGREQRCTEYCDEVVAVLDARDFLLTNWRQET